MKRPPTIAGQITWRGIVAVHRQGLLHRKQVVTRTQRDTATDRRVVVQPFGRDDYRANLLDGHAICESGYGRTPDDAINNLRDRADSTAFRQDARCCRVVFLNVPLCAVVGREVDRETAQRGAEAVREIAAATRETGREEAGEA